MSNNNEEDDYNDDYNDDFAEPEQEFVRNESPHDEQHAQKVNGKLEALQNEVENLTRSLNASLSKNKEVTEDQVKLREENSKLRDSVNSNGHASSGDSAQIAALRKQNDQLKEQLDSALTLGPSDCPEPLKKEFLKACKKTPEFSNLKSKDLSVDTCIKILKSMAMNSDGSVIGGASLEGGGSQVSLMSVGNESMSSKRIKQLEHELRVNSTAAQDIQSLRAKVIHMNERIRIEKEYKYRAEDEVKACNKKVDMLSSHMEKLVVHLKHEGAHKLRLAEQLRVAERESAAMADKCDLTARKSAAKDRLILELREGSKVLEDQLRLMDEKYMELRTKLDYARELGTKKIKKAEKTASDLRIKFALSNGSAILDSIPLPPEGSYMVRSTATGASWDGLERNSQSQYYPGGGDSAWGGQSPDGRPQVGWSHSAGGDGRGGGHSPISRGGVRANRSKSGKHPGGIPGSVSVSSSQQSLGGLGVHREPTMDGVLEKIRIQEGRKQDWNDDKIKGLLVRK